MAFRYVYKARERVIKQLKAMPLSPFPHPTTLSIMEMNTMEISSFLTFLCAAQREFPEA